VDRDHEGVVGADRVGRQRHQVGPLDGVETLGAGLADGEHLGAVERERKRVADARQEELRERSLWRRRQVAPNASAGYR
jgi:hypothetical protein